MVTPLTVYKASAGSGKTFTLATEYISLLVENPMNYRTILAVTFTNKATEEMKMRILSQLYGIWKQLPDSDDYVKTVQKKTGLDTKVISERAGISLSNLLNNYNYFRVETIDTFFQSVMRNMARELDLTTNLRIGLNDYQVEELAVDQLIADLSTTDAMLQWILRYIMENISDDKSWNVIGQIKQFGRHIFSDAYKDVSRALEEKLAEPGFFDLYATRLRELRQSAEQRMKQFADTFFDILESEGLTVDDFPYGKSGLCSFFLKLRQGQFPCRQHSRQSAATGTQRTAHSVATLQECRPHPAPPQSVTPVEQHRAEGARVEPGCEPLPAQRHPATAPFPHRRQRLTVHLREDRGPVGACDDR